MSVGCPLNFATLTKFLAMTRLGSLSLLWVLVWPSPTMAEEGNLRDLQSPLTTPSDRAKRTGHNPVAIDQAFEDTIDPNDAKKFAIALVANELQEVGHYVDWEKLRDEYVLAVLAEDTSPQRRKLQRNNGRKERRVVKRRARRKDWQLNTVAQQQSARRKQQQRLVLQRTDGAERGERTLESSEGSNAGNSGRQGVKDSVGASDGALVFVVNPTDAAGNPDNVAGRQTDDIMGIDDDAIQGIPIPIYNYTRGNCPGAGNSPAAVPCAPDNLSQLCDKYSGTGSFSSCFDACRPSFCCVHDAPPATNTIAPNCNTDVNCAQYAYCYIVWWKLHDTIGPATELRLEQTDDFFDVNASFVQGDVTNIAFYREMLFHHFNDAAEIIRLGTVVVNATLSVFNSDRIFLNSTYWNTTI